MLKILQLFPLYSLDTEGFGIFPLLSPCINQAAFPERHAKGDVPVLEKRCVWSPQERKWAKYRSWKIFCYIISTALVGLARKQHISHGQQGSSGFCACWTWCVFMAAIGCTWSGFLSSCMRSSKPVNQQFTPVWLHVLLHRQLGCTFLPKPMFLGTHGFSP